MYERQLVEKQELIQDITQELNGLRAKIKQQESTIFQLEKLKPEYDEMSGVVIKYREILPLNHQTERLHHEIETLTQNLSEQKRVIESLEFQKNELVKINIKLSQEVVKIKSVQ